MSIGNFEDPRLSPNFLPEYYPLCDGCPAPAADTEHPVEKRMIEFASIYYWLNQLYERLRKVRLQESKEDPAVILEQIDRAVHVRDALEDRLASEGFYAEPAIEGLITTNLIFSHALKRSVTPKAEPASSFSLFVPMPQPGEDLEAHLRRHLGPLFGIAPESDVNAMKVPKKNPATQKKRIHKKSSKSPGKDVQAPNPQTKKKPVPRKSPRK